jgi:hypothetical protein
VAGSSGKIFEPSNHNPASLHPACAAFLATERRVDVAPFVRGVQIEDVDALHGRFARSPEAFKGLTRSEHSELVGIAQSTLSATPSLEWNSPGTPATSTLVAVQETSINPDRVGDGLSLNAR